MPEMVNNSVQELNPPNRKNLNAKLLAELLGVSLQEMAEVLSVDRSLLTRHPTSSKIQGKLLGVVEIVRGELEGNLDHTRGWFHTPNRLLAGDTPLQALKQGKLDFLVGVVHRMESVTVYNGRVQTSRGVTQGKSGWTAEGCFATRAHCRLRVAG